MPRLLFAGENSAYTVLVPIFNVMPFQLDCEFKYALVNSELEESLGMLLLKDRILRQLGLPVDYPYC